MLFFSFLVVTDFVSAQELEWKSYETPLQNSWRNITYGNGKFVAISADSANRVMTSTNGIDWEISNFAYNTWLLDIIYADNKFVAVSGTGTNRVYTSPDGINWTPQLSPTPLRAWVSITYGEGLFVAVNYNSGAGVNQIMTSPDGITWTLRPIPHNAYWNSITYGNGLFVAVAYISDEETENPSKAIMVSEDGIDWEAMDTPEEHGYYSITYGDNRFVSLAFNANNLRRALVGTFKNSSSSITKGGIIGTRFCKDGETTFCRPRPT